MKPLDPRLLRRSRSARAHLVVLVVAGVLISAAVIAQAHLIATAVARVVDDAERGAARSLTALVVAAATLVAARAALVWWVERTSVRAGAAVIEELRDQLTGRALAERVRGTGRSRAEWSTLAIDGLDGLGPYVARYLPQLVLAVLVPVAVIGALALTDPTSAVIVVVTLPLIPVFMALIGRGTEAANRRRLDALTRLSHHFLDVVEGMATLRAFGRGKAQVTSVRTQTDHYRHQTMATLRVAFLSSLVLELLATLSVALVAVAVGLRLVDGELGLRTGLLAIMLAPEAYLPVRQVGAQFHAAATGVAAAQATFDLLDTPDPTPVGQRPVPAAGGLSVRVDEVSVQRPGRPDATPSGVSLQLDPGRIVAVVGPSGAGKSTLLAVVLGRLQPDHGAVIVSGAEGSVDLADLDRAAWWEAVAWVDQVPAMVEGTVADNLALGARHPHDPAELQAALARVGLAPSMLQRQVGERGEQLSAGERRRVALARALLRRPAVLVLDEPTAGLDADREAMVLDAVRAAARNGTAVLMVAHRPAAVAAADEVVHL